MSLYFADGDSLTFGVQSSNVAEVAQFSSTIDEAFIHLYTNNYQNIENTTTGVAIGTKSFSATSNDFYIGNITNNGTAVDRVLTVRGDRVGIRTSVPQAILHVVGSNLSEQSNILRVEAINSPPYPAFVINKYGKIGIGTEPDNNQLLTVRGKLVVDNIQVGGSSSSSSSRLITAYGMAPPSDASYLDFGYTTMSNISNIVTPLLQATNITQTITNIANYTFINDVTVSKSAPTTNGEVTFTTTFYGNSPSYVYTFTASNTATNADPTTIGPYTTMGNVDNRTVRFTSGTYIVHINASGSNGSGTGGTIFKPYVAAFTIGSVDLISTPTATLTQAPAPSFTNTTTLVSGIPYYTTGTTVTFPVSSIAFTNIYNVIDPRPLVPTALSINSQSFTHADIFTNVLTANSTNTRAIAITLSSTSNLTTSTAVPATVYNINSSNINTQFVPSIAYVGTPINEATTQIARYSSMPVSSVTRISIGSSAVTPSQPSAGEIGVFSSASPSTNDALFFPYDSTFYSSYANIIANRGTYAPSFTQVTGPHNILALRVQTTSQLYTFVLNLTGATGVQNVYVNWTTLNTWYNASTYYTLAGGCAASTPSSTRFAIRLPPGTTFASPSDIYITIVFSGSIPMSGISLTNQ